MGLFRPVAGQLYLLLLGWLGHIIRMEEGRIPKKVLNGKFCNKTSGKTKNQMGGCCAEGCITDIRDTRM
jgi:hypothetical protein